MNHSVKTSIRFMMLLVLLCSQLQVHAATKFRYDSSLPFTSPYSSDVIAHDVNITTFLEQDEVLARSDSGWRLKNPKCAEFISDSSSLVSTEDVIISFFGNHEITGEFWIRPESSDGTLLSWGDSASSHFITLFLDDARLNYHRYISDSLYTGESDTMLELNTWNYLHWVNRIQNSYFIFEVYLNGKKAVEIETLMAAPPAFTLLRSPVVVGFCTDPRALGPSFRGKLRGVSLYDRLQSDEYMNTPPPFDGSESFGMPQYLERGYLKVFSASSTPVQKTAYVPYSNDYYIPQGLASTYEDKRVERDQHMVYLSMYHKDLDGEIGGRNSIVVEMDPENDYRVRRCFRFISGPIYGHLSAMAYAAGYLYVGSESMVYQCELPEYDPNGGKYFDLEPKKTYNLYSSNLNFFDDTLWVGYWAAPNSSQRAFLFGYPLDTAGDINLTAAPTRYEIPNTNQGAAWTSYRGEKYLFICTSYGGTNNTKLYRYRKDRLKPTTLVEADTIFQVPAGGEDLSFDNDGNMIISSESSSRTYQLRTYYSPWNQFYPFVFEINPDILFQDVDSEVGIKEIDEPLTPERFGLNTFPNPFNNTLTINYQLVDSENFIMDVFDLRGQKVDTIIQSSHHTAGTYNTRWHVPQNLAGGIYLIRMEDGHGFSVSEKIIYLR